MWDYRLVNSFLTAIPSRWTIQDHIYWVGLVLVLTYPLNQSCPLEEQPATTCKTANNRKTSILMLWPHHDRQNRISYCTNVPNICRLQLKVISLKLSVNSSFVTVVESSNTVSQVLYWLWHWTDKLSVMSTMHATCRLTHYNKQKHRTPLFWLIALSPMI